MMKRILAVLLSVMMIMSLFAVVSFAKTTVTITADGVYSYDTLAGTKLHVVSEADLAEGESIEYYFNGTKVGEAAKPGDFAFTSVYGENTLSAKVVNANGVVATSNEITYNFKPLVFTNTLGSDTYDSYSASNYIYVAPATSIGTVTDSEKGSVLRVELAQNEINSWQIQSPKYTFGGKCETGYLSYEYDIKTESITVDDKVVAMPRAFRLFVLKGKSGAGEINGPIMDWPGGSVAGTPTRQGLLVADAWNKVRVVFDMDSRTYDVYVNAEQIISDKAIPDALVNPDFVIAPKPSVNAKYTTHNTVFYLDNLKVERYVKSDVTLNAPASAVAGGKAMISASCENIDGCRYIYNVNGTESEITSDATYIADIIPGENTAFVKAVDENGNEIAMSDAVTFTGIYRNFKAHKTYGGASSDESVLWFDNTENSDNGITEKVDLSNSENEEDAAHGTVYHFYMKDLNWKNIGFTDGMLATSAATLGSVSGQDTISLSWDIKKNKMDSTSNSNYFGSVAYKDAQGTEMSFVPFLFSGDNHLYIATDFTSVSDTNKGIVIPAPNGKWYNLSVIADDVTDTVSLSVNGVVYSSFAFDATEGKTFDMTNTISNFYIKRFNICRGDSAANKGERDIYFDNLTWSYSKESSLTVNVLSENAIAGKKVGVSVAGEELDGCKFVYNVNGIDSEPVSDAIYNADVVLGENTVYAKAVDANGNTVVTSDAVSFNGIYRDFTAHKTYTGAKSDESVLYFDDNEDSDNGITEKIDLSNSENAEDAAHGTVYHFYMKDLNWKTIGLLTGYLKNAANTLGGISGQDTISLSWDIKKNKMDSASNSNYFASVAYKDAQGNEKSFVPFLFSGDNQLYIATDFTSVSDTNKGVVIPAPNGKWYNLSVIADDVTDTVYLSVNDVIYSSFAFDATEGKTFDMANSLSNFYLNQFNICRGDSAANKGERDIYFDNLTWSYSKAPSVLTAPVFANNGAVIVEKADINYADALSIEFDAINEGYDVICAAAVVDSANGTSKLIEVSAKTLTFDEGQYNVPVQLSLTDLPEDIATNSNYSIKIMVWNIENCDPLCSTIFLD